MDLLVALRTVRLQPDSFLLASVTCTCHGQMMPQHYPYSYKSIAPFLCKIDSPVCCDWVTHRANPGELASYVGTKPVVQAKEISER